MIIRNGFVSNSSTSSFLIYGVCLDDSEIKDLLGVTSDEEGDEIDDVYEVLDEKLPKGLEHYRPEYDDSYYIGASWSNVGDDETGKQFKERVENDLKSVFGDKLSGFSTLEYAWRDG